MMPADASARTAEVLVAITSHFKEQRLPYLAQTLRALSLWEVSHMQVVVFANDAGEPNITRLTRLCAETCGSYKCEIRVISSLEDPWKLTWAHKELIKSEFLQGDRRFSHFIYIEDDIELQEPNFSYWLSAREILRSKNLLPSFLRLEYESVQAAWATSDVFWKIFIPCQSYVCIDTLCWVSMPNPYNPLFIMDRELAQEYVLSRSFDEIESTKLCSWDLATRAAMGLCNEGIPRSFPHRYVVPVTNLGRPLNSCQIFHIPSNYALNPGQPLGKVRLDQLFAGVSTLKPQATSEDKAFPHPSRHEAEQTSPHSVIRHRYCAAESGTDIYPDWTTAVNLPLVAPEIRNGFVLVSHHDTILFYDFEAFCLRQEPFGIAPLNLVISFRGDRAQLFAIDPDNNIWAVVWGGTVRPFESDLYDIERKLYSDDTFSISSNRKFVSASLNGEITWHNDWCRQWERFKVIRVDTIIGLAWLRRENWIAENGEVLSWHDQPFDFGNDRPWEGSALSATISKDALASRRAFKFGTSRIFLTAIHHQTFFLDPEDHSEPPTNLRIVEPEGSRSCFKRLL
jgi:hypothetical protein